MTLPIIAALKTIDRVKLLKAVTYIALTVVVVDLAWYLRNTPTKNRV
jgi:hypothetical protein